MALSDRPSYSSRNGGTPRQDSYVSTDNPYASTNRTTSATRRTSTTRRTSDTRSGSKLRLNNNSRLFGNQSQGGFFSNMDTHTLRLIAIALAILIAVALLVSSCMRACSKSRSEGNVGTTNELDARVAAGVSSELTTDLAATLDQNEKLAKIAQNAGNYPDERVVRLALQEDAAVDFVLAYPDAEKTSSPYEDKLSQGTVPRLFNWDSRWGNVDYAGLPLAVSGSGPTCFAMGYMGLTGKNDKTPADIAALATADGLTEHETFTNGKLYERESAGLGLRCDKVEPSVFEIVESLRNGHPVICEIKPNTLTNEAHWVICASLNENDTVNVYDPTSQSVSLRPWAAETILQYSSSMYVLQLDPNAQTQSTTDTTDASTKETTTDSTQG